MIGSSDFDSCSHMKRTIDATILYVNLPHIFRGGLCRFYLYPKTFYCEKRCEVHAKSTPFAAVHASFLFSRCCHRQAPRLVAVRKRPYQAQIVSMCYPLHWREYGTVEHTNIYPYLQNFDASMFCPLEVRQSKQSAKFREIQGVVGMCINSIMIFVEAKRIVFFDMLNFLWNSARAVAALQWSLSNSSLSGVHAESMAHYNKLMKAGQLTDYGLK